VEAFNEKKKFDVFLFVTRNVMVQWWTEETHVNLNKSEVIRKRSGLGIYDEKVIHFLIKKLEYIFTFKFVDS
jgi:hypothetical protein